MKPVARPLPLDLLHFDFSCPGERMGLPHAYADGKLIDVFAVPSHFCNDESATARSWSFGNELGLCTLAWIRRFYLHEATGDLDATIECPGFPDFAQFIRLFGQDQKRGLNGWRYGTHDSYFTTLEDALHHAVTARGDPERDGMVPAELDTLTNEVIEQRLRAALSGERLNDVVFRTALPE